MCNLYSLGKQGPDALRAHFAAERDETGNMPPLPSIFPKTLAPVVLIKDGETTDDLYAFLTTTPNAEVGPINPKAMPVILTTAEDQDAWLRAPWAEAGALQRPLPDGSLVIVARGEKRDGAPSGERLL